MAVKGFLMLLVLFGWSLTLVSTESITYPRNPYSQQLPNVTGRQSPAVKELMSIKSIVSRQRLDAYVVSELIIFLTSVSPSHQLCILYDDTFNDNMDSILKVVISSGIAVTLVNYSRGYHLEGILLHYPLTSTTIDRLHVLLLCSLDNMAAIFQMVALGNHESRSIWWILILTAKKEMFFLQDFLREGSHVVVVEVKDSQTISLFSSRINKNGEVRFKEVGNRRRTSAGYENYMLNEVFMDLEDLYSDLGGRELTITAMDNNPYIVLENDDAGGHRAVAGFEYTMMKTLGEALNFSQRFTTPADRKWGGPLPNGTVVGMIGDVAKREAHFSISELTITGVRETVIDFTYPHYIETLTLLSRAPREKNRTFAAFSPFTLFVWICIAGSVLLVGGFLALESWIMDTYLLWKPEGYSFGDSVFNMFRSIVKQNNLLLDKYWPQKFTYVFWYLFCLNVSVLYSGVLIATLIKPSFEKPIDSLTELPDATRNGFTLVITKGTSMEYLFKSATEGIYAETWKLFNHREPAKSFIRHSKDVMWRINDDKLVLINGHLSLRYLAMEEGIRQFYFARYTFAPQYYGAACIPGAPYLPAVNKMLSYMLEGGLISKWRDNEFQKIAGNNIAEEPRGPRPFSVRHLQAAFYILLLGFLIGATTLIGEQISSCFLQ